MSIAWDDCKRVAEFLKGEAEKLPDPSARYSEAMRRAACSRAYYFAFYKARIAGIERGFTEAKDKGKHAQLWDWWKRHTGIQDVTAAGRELHDWRVDVDYFPTPCSPKNMRDFFEAADDLVKLVEDVESKVPGTI